MTVSSMERHNSQYSSLFKTGNIGKLSLPNRFLMAAMGNALADEKGHITPAMLDYYRARAEGGVSLVITQFASVSQDAVMTYNPALYDDSFLDGIRQLVRTVHDQGAKVCIQLMHPGMLFLLLKPLPAGINIQVPDIVPIMGKDKPYHKLETSEIERIVRDFADAAVRVKAAGADAVEIHACHGCLLSTFLTPAINRRNDSYGGSVENRTRFAREVIEQVRAKLGRDFPLMVRINGSDDVEGGVTTQEVVQQSLILKSAGADAISISSGLEYWTTLMAPSYLTPEGVMLPVAEAVKKATNLPVITSGKITPELADKSVAAGKMDFVAYGRPLLADPEMPRKLHDGLDSEWTRCLYCNNCLRTSWRSCTVNPFLYRENMLPNMTSGSSKKIMVIGGGLAGMFAAVMCRRRGHQVTLFEKEAVLGGQWNIACAIPGKAGYTAAINDLRYQLDKLQIPVKLNTVVDPELARSFKPDAAVIATGGIPQELDLPGINNNKVVQANSVILGKVDPQGRICVVGGSQMAMETAVLLASRGKEVSLVSHSALGGRKGPDDMITFRGLLRKLVQLRVPIYLNAALTEITANSVVFGLAGEMIRVPADTVVSAIGVRPVDALASELKGIVPEIYLVGDCVMPGSAAQATYSAAKTALKI